MTDLTRLVKAAQGGDRRAFGELYTRYARMVHGILLARVGWKLNRVLAERESRLIVRAGGLLGNLLRFSPAARTSLASKRSMSCDFDPEFTRLTQQH